MKQTPSPWLAGGLGALLGFALGSLAPLQSQRTTTETRVSSSETARGESAGTPEKPLALRPAAQAPASPPPTRESVHKEIGGRADLPGTRSERQPKASFEAHSERQLKASRLGDVVRSVLGAPLEPADQAWVLRRILESSGPDAAADELFAVWADIELGGSSMNPLTMHSSSFFQTKYASPNPSAQEVSALGWVRLLSFAFEESQAGGLEPFLLACLARLEQGNPSDTQRLAFGLLTSRWLPEDPDRYFPALLASADRNYGIARFCFSEVLATGDLDRAWALLVPWFDDPRSGWEARPLALQTRTPEVQRTFREKVARDPKSSPWEVGFWVLELNRENPAQALAALEELMDLRPDSVAPSLLTMAREDEPLFQAALEAARQAQDSVTPIDWINIAERAGEFGTDRRDLVLNAFAQWAASDSFRPDDEEHRDFSGLAEQLTEAAVDGRPRADLLPVLERMSVLHVPDPEDPEYHSYDIEREAEIWFRLGETGRAREWLDAAIRHALPEHAQSLQDIRYRFDIGLPPWE